MTPVCNCRIVPSVVWGMELHNGQFFTALAEVAEMCGQAEMIVAFIVQPVLLPVDGGGKAVPHYKLESFAFNFSSPSVANTLYCQPFCSFFFFFKSLSITCRGYEADLSYRFLLSASVYDVKVQRWTVI